MELLTNKTDYNANITENNPNKAGFFEVSILLGGFGLGGGVEGGGSIWFPLHISTRNNLISITYAIC